MEPQTGKANGRKRGRPAKGRTEADKQSAVPDPAALAERITNLCELLMKAKNAAKAYDEGVSAAASACGFNASEVGKFVKARVGENYDTAEKKARQLVLLFDEIGQE